jgi:branched-chain amino acid aminotransferase
MNECFGNSFILNGELQPAELFENHLVYDGDSIYEVLRMVKGKPLFLNDHFERLSVSAGLQQRRMLADFDTLRNDIIALARSERMREVNLKIVFNYNKFENYLIYLIESVYPTKEQYKNGVKGSLFKAERKDPESKVIDHKLRTEIYHKLLKESAYEALLVNRNNCITEGSRSNIFFIKDQSLFTAPEETVLSGVTRKHVIDICRENGTDVKFACISSEAIQEYDSVVMTGTSPVILPFYCIDNIYFNPYHPLISLLRNLYLERADESIRKFAGQ